MPDKETLERAEEDRREGKSASTQAGEFVRQEMHHIREGKHGARNTKQAIAIGLSEARRAGIPVGAKKGTASKGTRRKASRDISRGRSRRKPSRTRARATSKALRREGHGAASRKSLSRQGRAAAASRSKASRTRAAKKAAATRKRK